MQVWEVKDNSYNKYLRNVVLDDGSVLTLPVYFVQKNGIVEGKELSGEQVAEIRRDVILPKVRKKALDYLSKRVYGRQELLDKLIAFGFFPEDIVPVLEKYIELGYLDDENFARSYVHDALLLKRQPVRRVRFDLMQKGIAPELIEAAIEEFDGAEVENLRREVEKALSRLRQEDEVSREAVMKIKARLCRKGYLPREVDRALREGLD